MSTFPQNLSWEGAGIMGKYQDVTGQRFTRLVAVKDVGPKTKKGVHYWQCICDCGNIVEVDVTSLKSGNTQSCGCYGKEQRKIATQKKFTKYGGLTKHALYRTWTHMKQRCVNPRDRAYKHYGGRGIYVVDDWSTDFMAFYNWSIENGWADGLTLDRIDNDGPYAPWNCRWTSMAVQCRNRRNSKIIEYNGKIQNLVDWSKEYNIDFGLLSWRLKQGWPMEEALTWRGHKRHTREELNELQQKKRA